MRIGGYDRGKLCLVKVPGLGREAAVLYCSHAQHKKQESGIWSAASSSCLPLALLSV